MATKDYVKRGRSAKKPTRHNRKKPASNRFPIQWAMLALILVGALGYGLYFLSSSPAPEPAKPMAVEPKSKPNIRPKNSTIPPKPEEKWRYIEALENKEVQVESKPAQKPGRPYLMQCGAYRSQDQAEQRKAMIAFQGLESQIKTSQGEKGNWYRVILGPYPQKRKAESDRNMLRRAKIEPCAIWFWE